MNVISRYIGKWLRTRSDKSIKEKDLAIVAIAKNEADYIKEWVAFHKAVGIDHIILYDNDSTDGMRDQIEDFIKEEFVIYNTISGSLQQYNAYNNALSRYGKKFKYMAFIDCDEFLFPVNHNESVVSVIDKFFERDSNLGGVVVNWAMYGSSGFEKKPEGFLIQNFLYRADLPKGKGTSVVKTICRPELVKKYSNPHYPVYKMGIHAVSCSTGTIVPLWENTIEEYKGLRLNHYFTKSKEEWIRRREGVGRADLSSKRTIDEFYEHDNNDVRDDSALFYLEKMKEILNEKYKK